jgi:hypothetical protein
MKIKVKFKAIKYHGSQCTFVENIEVPDDLTTVEQQDNYVNELDKSDIMFNRELHAIINFWRYIKKPKGEKKPSWKDVAAKWETACATAEDVAAKWMENYESSVETASIWEKNSMDWKKLLLTIVLTLKNM